MKKEERERERERETQSGVGDRTGRWGERNGKKETESGIASPPLRQVSFSFRHPFTFSVFFPARLRPRVVRRVHVTRMRV